MKKGLHATSWNGEACCYAEEPESIMRLAERENVIMQRKKRRIIKGFQREL